MARSISWRRACPDQMGRRIDQALEARFYILRETGPTGFLVKEDEHGKKFKVLADIWNERCFQINRILLDPRL